MCKQQFVFGFVNLIHVEDGSDLVISQFHDVDPVPGETGSRYVTVDPVTQVRSGKQRRPSEYVERQPSGVP